MRLVVEHLRGQRRGDRDVFDEPKRISFGRHPQNDVAFDARADIDASSRHAEIRLEGAAYVLRDVGSSNGTFVDGELIHELPLAAGKVVEVDLGAGGPRVRIWLGASEADRDEAPSPAGGRALAGRRAIAAIAIAALAGLVALWLAF